ncbi:MAG: ATP synthase F1 subunit epsilon [Solobacterium sp.]|nr:ATP synthase F1 subunit epsilon [Solobacterium sp.]
MIHCRIVTPHGIYKEFDTTILNIETEEGQRGILPNHMPLVTMLKIGRLESEEDGVRNEYAIAGGLFYFRDNEAEILTDAIEHEDEIDIERAQQAKERAERRLQDENYDMKRAEIALKKALNRIKIAGK